MDELRAKRYKDKINFIISSIKLLTDNPQNELEKRGVFYSLQTSIESVVDLIAMAVKDIGIPVKDDESNILELVKKYKVEPSLGEDLKVANGMRDILVHRYNAIEEELIFNSIKKVKNLLLDWLKIIEGILSELTED